MHISQEKKDDFLILKISEIRLDASNSKALKEYLSVIINESDDRIILDLSEVDFMDSSGLAALLPFVEKRATEGHRMLLAGLSIKVQRLFSLTRLDSIFAVYPTVNDAIKG